MNWLAAAEGRVVHVVPLEDIIEHDSLTDEPDCICGPALEWVDGGEEGDGWIIVHASLDGRELHERADELDELEEADDDDGDGSEIDPGAGA